MDTVWSKALKLLEERGWYQAKWGLNHSGYGSNGALCISNAVAEAANSPLFVYFDRLKEAIGIPPELLSDAVYRWNDDPERTFAEVRELLLRLHESDVSRQEE